MEEQPQTAVPGLGLPGLNLAAAAAENKAPGLGFNLGNLEGLKDGQEDTLPFSWEREFATIPDNSVASKKINENVDKYTCLATITTLENETFELECSMSRGIKILSSNSGVAGGVQDKKFDSLEAFLMNVSHQYIKALQSDRAEG